MNINKTDIGKLASYGALLILLSWALQNLKLLISWVGIISGLFAPFVLGLVIAFIINVPMVQLERLLFARARGRLRAMARMLSLVLTVVLVVGLVFVVLFLVVPELASSVATLGNSVPGYVEQVGRWATALAADYPEVYQSLTSLSLDWNSMISNTMNVIQSGVSSILTSTVSVAAGIFSGVFSFFLAVVFAVYILLQKESLSVQMLTVLHAFVPERAAKRTVYLCSLTNRTFVSFLSGQCLEAVILGLLFFVTLSIFRLPYALMISVLTGFTALIPIFGAFIGCAVGAFLILMVSPVQAVWFLVIFIIIQQLEGNLIYPKVVGGSIGLPAIWVLLAVTVGGGAMGIAGMLIFIPLCSVLYTLLWEAVTKRTHRKEGINEETT